MRPFAEGGLESEQPGATIQSQVSKNHVIDGFSPYHALHLVHVRYNYSICPGPCIMVRLYSLNVKLPRRCLVGLIKWTPLMSCVYCRVFGENVANRKELKHATLGSQGGR